MKNLQGVFAGAVLRPTALSPATLGLATLMTVLIAPIIPAAAADVAAAQRCDAPGPRLVSACARQSYYHRHNYRGPQVYRGPPPPVVVYKEPDPYYYGPGNGYPPYYEGPRFFYRPYYSTGSVFPFFDF